MLRVFQPALERPPAAEQDATPRWRPRDLLRLLRPLPLILLVAWWAQHGGGVPATAAREADLPHAVVVALADRGLKADAAEVFLVDAPPGTLGSRFAKPRVVLRAKKAEEPADVYLARLRLSPEGRLLEIEGLYNLSDTSAVDERTLTVSEGRVAWTIAGGGKTYLVYYMDLRGEPKPRGEGWGFLPRWQNRLTNLQQTGQLVGIGERSFKLDPAADKLTLAFGPEALFIESDARKIVIPTQGDGPIVGQRFLQEQGHQKALPGNLVTWAVDRARAMPWLGSDRMQLFKAVAFAALDFLQRFMGNVTGDTGAERVAEEFGDVTNAAPITYTDPATGWPPAQLEPMLSPVLEGEGKWRSLDNDPFIQKNPDAPAPFITTFIRTDPKRAYTQIFITMWDPRQVALHCMSGTVEPKSATGETGPGLVPRKPEVMSRLVGAFNGGFQATHGEFGMMADGVVYLPPKPFGATVAELKDGSTGFGTWPREEAVPDDIVSFRQNMTPLVQDGTINPYKRNWWGGVPPGWTDESRTVRSAVCMTKEGFAAYLYGSSTDADQLALAMQRARCIYGIHLDMNPGHTGLEFYRAAPKGQLPELGRALDGQWEALGDVSGMDGWQFMGRRMLRYMGLMNFPRYIGREARDFFYLTLRHVLPGEPLKSAVAKPEPSEGVWTVKGLPQHGYPYALATTTLRPDAERPETKLRVLKLDPNMLTLEGDDTEQVVVSFPAPDPPTAGALWLSEAGFTLSAQAPPGEVKLLASALADKDRQKAQAMLCLSKTDGMLIFAEVATALSAGRDAEKLEKLGRTLGCGELLLFDQRLRPALGGARDLSGHPVTKSPSDVKLLRRKAPGAKRIFTDTPIVPAKEWYPLQAKRVRYFRKPTAPAASSAP